MIRHVKYFAHDIGIPLSGSPMVSGDEMAILLSMCVGRKSILEIGTWKGITTNNLLKSGCEVVTIDISEPPKTLTGSQSHEECLPAGEIGKEISKDLRNHCKQVVYNPNQPNGLKNKLKEINLKYDLIFIDGDHSYDGVRTDYNETLPYLKADGIFLFTNVWWKNIPRPVEGPYRLVDELDGLILNGTNCAILLDHIDRFLLL